MNLAREAIREGRSLHALEALRQATSVAPNNADAWALLGWVHNDLGDAREADASLVRAIALDPGHLEALNTLGVIASESADPGAAIRYFEQALALDKGAHLGCLGQPRARGLEETILGGVARLHVGQGDETRGTRHDRRADGGGRAAP